MLLRPLLFLHDSYKHHAKPNRDSNCLNLTIATGKNGCEIHKTRTFTRSQQFTICYQRRIHQFRPKLTVLGFSFAKFSLKSNLNCSVISLHKTAVVCLNRWVFIMVNLFPLNLDSSDSSSVLKVVLIKEGPSVSS